jgi:phosphatidylglycerol:prolipoprotein diacylglycerol transferase
MLPTLPFGPLALPTGPVVILLAVTLGLELAGRYGRRLGLHTDEVWNTGLLALLAGLVVARLWNVVQLWPIYRDDPGLILSLRPGGFALLPGVAAALLAGYANLVRRALDPLRVAACLAVGAVAAGIVLEAGAYLTGAVVGEVSNMPWALSYFGQLRHPVAIYRALGLWLLFIILWLDRRRNSPQRTLLLAGFGYSLIRLVTDAFVDGPALLGSFRLNQVVAFASTLLFAWLLARDGGQTTTTNGEMSESIPHD